MVNRAECALLAEEFRARFNIDNLSPIDVFFVANQIPLLTTVLYPLSKSISGMSVKGEGFMLAAINSGQTYGRQRFTLGHELYHLFYDEGMQSTVVCPADATEQDEIEQQADAFASYLLLPRLALINEVRNRNLASINNGDELLQNLLEIEARYQVSHACLLLRLTEEGVIDARKAAPLKLNIKKNARRLGFSTRLYEPRNGYSAKQADGAYVSFVGELLGNETISRGKAKELLADAFRDDIFITEFDEEAPYD